MFRTRVLYLWLHMIGAAALLLLAAVAAAALLAADDSLLLVPLLAFPLALAACALATFGSALMLPLLQRLLIGVGRRCGRPADFRAFRRALAWHSLVPAVLPALLLLVPQVRATPWPALALVLGAWALATVAVWRWYARRLHTEWEAGLAY